jgi:hypothetical protein
LVMSADLARQISPGNGVRLDHFGRLTYVNRAPTE